MKLKPKQTSELNLCQKTGNKRQFFCYPFSQSVAETNCLCSQLSFTSVAVTKNIRFWEDKLKEGNCVVFVVFYNT